MHPSGCVRGKCNDVQHVFHGKARVMPQFCSGWRCRAVEPPANCTIHVPGSDWFETQSQQSCSRTLIPVEGNIYSAVVHLGSCVCVCVFNANAKSPSRVTFNRCCFCFSHASPAPLFRVASALLYRHCGRKRDTFDDFREFCTEIISAASASELATGGVMTIMYT